MLTLGEKLLVLGQNVTNRFYEKLVIVDAGNRFNAKVRDADELTIATIFGENADPREYACLHGQKPFPQLEMQQVIQISGQGRFRVVKTPLNTPGSPFWECYIKREVEGKDT